MKIAAILLAAGRSSRFGAPKLAANLGGKPVGTHAAAVIAQLPMAARFAVVGPDTPDFADFGFQCVPLEPLEAPLSRSIAMGIARAISAGADAALIVLADMPFVPVDHFQALLAHFDGHCIGTRAAGKAMPPAIFGQDLFGTLSELKGDAGARHLLETAPSIDLPVELALDIDTVSDLELAEQQRRA